MIETVETYENIQFSEWQKNILNAFSDQVLSQKYQMKGQLMEFDFGSDGKSEGLLKVNYSERLVTLVKDYRALVEQGKGGKIDDRIGRVVDNAKKFYKEGVTLKQIANFYNSMNT